MTREVTKPKNRDAPPHRRHYGFDAIYGKTLAGPTTVTTAFRATASCWLRAVAVLGCDCFPLSACIPCCVPPAFATQVPGMTIVRTLSVFDANSIVFLKPMMRAMTQYAPSVTLGTVIWKPAGF